jgi:hypothetical protein
MIKLHFYIIFAGLWAIINGLLHDIFVLREKRPYDKELIRLLIDGHILIFSGIFYFLCYNGIKDGQSLAYIISITVSVFLVGYCALIYKMLPSIGTILVNLVALVWLIIQWYSL